MRATTTSLRKKTIPCPVMMSAKVCPLLSRLNFPSRSLRARLRPSSGTPRQSLSCKRQRPISWVIGLNGTPPKPAILFEKQFKRQQRELLRGKRGKPLDEKAYWNLVGCPENCATAPPRILHCQKYSSWKVTQPVDQRCRVEPRKPKPFCLCAGRFSMLKKLDSIALWPIMKCSQSSPRSARASLKISLPKKIP